MKKTRWFDTLARSTKATVVICGTLVVGTAVTMLVLMFHPIVKEDQPTVVVEPVRHTEYSTTTHETTTTAETTRPKPTTLSTWNAGINGYSRSLDEFMETTTTDPRLRRSETTSVGTTAELHTTTFDEYETTVYTDDSGETPGFSTVETTRPQTVTTTVEEVPEITAPPLPVEVDIPAPDAPDVIE